MYCWRRFSFSLKIDATYMVATQNWDMVNGHFSQPLHFWYYSFVCVRAIDAVFRVVYHGSLFQGSSEIHFAENKMTFSLKSLHEANLSCCKVFPTFHSYFLVQSTAYQCVCELIICSNIIWITDDFYSAINNMGIASSWTF